MRKTLLLTATSAIILMASSCGNQPSKEVRAPLAGAHSATPQDTPMPPEAFSQLLIDLIPQLPASVMPAYLQTEEQRREVVTQYTDNSDNTNSTTFSHWRDYEHDYGYDRWEMAGYLTADNRNILLIVQYGSGLDGFELKSDKTLNYNIETQEFTEIERPIEMPTVDEMIVEANFNNQPFYQKAKEYFSKKMEFHYIGFNKEGFAVYLNVWYFWEKNIDAFDKYVTDRMIAWYKWDGERFYKYKILNDRDFEEEY